jgi:hypothetical protein
MSRMGSSLSRILPLQCIMIFAALSKNNKYYFVLGELHKGNI